MVVHRKELRYSEMARVDGSSAESPAARVQQNQESVSFA